MIAMEAWYVTTGAFLKECQDSLVMSKNGDDGVSVHDAGLYLISVIGPLNVNSDTDQ
jgi:hypothetical protein